MKDVHSSTAALPGGGVDAPPYFGPPDDAVTDPAAQAVFALVDEYLANHPGGRERLIPLLHRVQEEIGYLPFAIQEYIAEGLGMSPIQVYEVVSFYHFFTTTPRGRFQVKVCMGTACFVRGATQLLHTLSDTLDLEVGSISDDHLFNLDQVRCIGACGLAPALMVGDDVHGNIDPAGARKLVRKLKIRAAKEAKDEAEQQRAGSDD